MEFKDAFTLTIAGIGAILGIINSVHQVRAGRTRLKVECTRYFIPAPFGGAPESVAIRVTNLSIFPVVVTQTGFWTRDGKQVIPHPLHATIADRPPKKLERGEYLMVCYEPGLFKEDGIESITHCFARTSTGHFRKGNVRALVDYLKHVERA